MRLQLTKTIRFRPFRPEFREETLVCANAARRRGGRGRDGRRAHGGRGPRLTSNTRANGHASGLAVFSASGGKIFNLCDSKKMRSHEPDPSDLRFCPRRRTTTAPKPRFRPPTWQEFQLMRPQVEILATIAGFSRRKRRDGALSAEGTSGSKCRRARARPRQPGRRACRPRARDRGPPARTLAGQKFRFAKGGKRKRTVPPTGTGAASWGFARRGVRKTPDIRFSTFAKRNFRPSSGPSAFFTLRKMEFLTTGGAERPHQRRGLSRSRTRGRPQVAGAPSLQPAARNLHQSPRGWHDRKQYAHGGPRAPSTRHLSDLWRFRKANSLVPEP